MYSEYSDLETEMEVKVILLSPFPVVSITHMVVGFIYPYIFKSFLFPLHEIKVTRHLQMKEYWKIDFPCHFSVFPDIMISSTE